MALTSIIGGKRKRRITKTKVVKKRVVKRRLPARGGATKKRVVRKTASAKRTTTVIKFRRIKGKPRGDQNGAKYVGKILKEERAKKGSPLTLKERSVIFKRGWAEYKARKGKK